MDGLPNGFYVARVAGGWPILCTMSAGGTSGRPDLPAAQGGRPKDHLAGFRHIILLTGGPPATRKQRPLQTGCTSHSTTSATACSPTLSRGEIAENVLHHLQLAEFLCDSQHPTWLLITDLSWAYDNVDRQFLLGYRLSEAYGIKVNGQVRWAELLHNGNKGKVLINGTLHGHFSSSQA